MGLCNTPAAFHSLKNSIFADCLKELFVHLDDILTVSRTNKEHLQHLHLVFSQFREGELHVGRGKCSFMKEGTKFLDLIARKGGIKIGRDHVYVIKEWNKPASITEFRRFIGPLQFPRRFLKNISQAVAPLTNLTEEGSGSKY